MHTTRKLVDNGIRDYTVPKLSSDSKWCILPKNALFQTYDYAKWGKGAKRYGAFFVPHFNTWFKGWLGVDYIARGVLRSRLAASSRT